MKWLQISQIALNLLFNFSKQTSTVADSSFHEITPLFRLFTTFNLLGYISEITASICEIDATRTSWGLLHLNQIVTSVTLQFSVTF